MRFRFLLVMMMAALVGLSACTTPDHSAAKPPPRLGFVHLNPFVVKDGSTRIVQSFQQDAQTTALSYEFGQSPVALLQSYAQSRFLTQQMNPILAPRFVFDIKRARLSQITEATDPLQFMTGLSEDKYKIEISLALSEIAVNGQQFDPHTIYYEQILTVSSNVTLTERDYAQFEFYERVITDIDKAVSDIVMNKLF